MIPDLNIYLIVIIYCFILHRDARIDAMEHHELVAASMTPKGEHQRSDDVLRPWQPVAFSLEDAGGHLINGVWGIALACRVWSQEWSNTVQPDAITITAALQDGVKLLIKSALEDTMKQNVKHDITRSM